MVTLKQVLGFQDSWLLELRVAGADEVEEDRLLEGRIVGEDKAVFKNALALVSVCVCVCLLPCAG